MTAMDFALNHMVAPHRSLRDVFALARTLGIGTVEIRNDLQGRAIADGTPPGDVRAEADRAGISIASINALYPFNIWNDERAAQARGLIDYAAASGAKGIVLCPLNDPTHRATDGARLAALRAALTALKPMLALAGVVGLVEPLGFAESSLRLKREAVDAIRAIGGIGTFTLVHDTFHHHVAGDTELFPDMTGLVHVSGVVDPTIGVAEMRDPHRVLVDARDRLDNLGQVRALRAGGYRGPLSFEPFASAVHDLDDVAGAIRASMEFIAGGIGRPAA